MKVQWKKWFVAIPATVVGLLPQILFDLSHKCAQLCGLVAWAGYRTVASTGFDGKHGYTLEKFGLFFQLLWRHLSSLISTQPIVAALFLMTFLIVIIRLLKIRKQHDSLFIYSLAGLSVVLL
jgi:hypothetical protein